MEIIVLVRSAMLSDCVDWHKRDLKADVYIIVPNIHAIKRENSLYDVCNDLNGSIMVLGAEQSGEIEK